MSSCVVAKRPTDSVEAIGDSKVDSWNILGGRGSFSCNFLHLSMECQMQHQCLYFRQFLELFVHEHPKLIHCDETKVFYLKDEYMSPCLFFLKNIEEYR